MESRKKNTPEATQNASARKRRSRKSPPLNRLTRSEYEFKCKLRNPDFQRELRAFHRDFPVLYRLSTGVFSSYGGLESKARREWGTFLQRHAAILQKSEESDSYIVYKFAPKTVHQAIKLKQLGDEVSDLGQTLAHEANLRFGVEPQRFLEQIEKYTNFIASIIREPLFANQDYFDRIGRKPTDHAAREAEFADKWSFFPSWCGPVRPPIVVDRKDVPYLDRGITLFIPVTDATTRMEINQSWPEVVKRQSYAYSKKKKHARANYELRLKVYDLKQRDRTSLEITQELSLSLSGVEKVYRRAFQDVRGLMPSKVRKSKKMGICAPYSSEGEEVILHAASVELGVPLDSLRNPSLLTQEQTMDFGDWLYKRSQAKQKFLNHDPKF